MDYVRNRLSFLERDLLEEIIEQSSIVNIPRGTELLREHQYVKVLPIVIDGFIKVYSRFKEKELLLYYIEPAQSCVMSFYSALKNSPSRVFAVAEDDSKVLSIPVRFLPEWLKEYPGFNELFYHQFNLRYSELLDTISHLLLDNLDKRLFDHLKKKIKLTNGTSIKKSHGQLADELGTSREVVSRVMKKLESEGKLFQESGTIHISGYQ